MADNVRITNMADSGSVARVAFEMVNVVRHLEDATAMSRTAYLDLYAECYVAADGRRRANTMVS